MAARKTRVRNQCLNCTEFFDAFLADIRRGHGKFCKKSCYVAYRTTHPEEYKTPRPCQTDGCDRLAAYNQKHCKECTASFAFLNRKPRVTTLPRRRQTCPGCTRAFVWQPVRKKQTRTYCSVACARRHEAKSRGKAPVEKTIALHAQGMTPTDINEKLGFHRSSTPAFTVLRRAGLIPQKKSRALELPIGHVVEMYQNRGFSTYKIASILQCSQYAIWKVLNDEDVRMRPAGFGGQDFKMRRDGGLCIPATDTAFYDRHLDAADLFNPENPDSTALRIATRGEMERVER